MTTRILAQRAIQLGLVLGAALLWQWTTLHGDVSPLLLPPLSSVYQEFRSLLIGATFWPDLYVTLYELAMAFLAAAVAGMLLGYLISRSKYSVRVFDPLLAGIYSIPAILLFPLYVLFFGIGSASKIAMGATIAFFPIVLNTISGLTNVQPSYILAARSMGASSLQMFWNVLFPAAFPSFLRD
jgi:ABC-type nitrate/sulfonate/bicarbonate transport system permease component